MNLQARIQEEFNSRSYKVLVPIAGISVLITPVWILMDYFSTPATWKTLAVIRLIGTAFYLVLYLLLKKKKISWKTTLYAFIIVTSAYTGYMIKYIPSEILSKFLTGYSIVYIVIAALLYITWQEYLLMFGIAVFFLVVFNALFQVHPMDKMLLSDGTMLWAIGGFGTVAVHFKYTALIREITAQVKNELLTQELQAANEELSQKNEEIHKQSEFVKNLNLKLEKQNTELFKKNKDITDSIRVAKRIQGALLATNKKYFRLFPPHFIFFRPKDIVSGDFYWFYGNEKEKLLAVADCTGHGVPGSLLSVLGLNILNELVKENIKTPNIMLNELRERINRILNPEGSTTVMYEGMDISLLKINDNNQIEWAGANNPLYVITQNEKTLKNLAKYQSSKSTLQEGEKTLLQIPADKMPVGYFAAYEPFTLHSLEIQKGDELVLFSDGFSDQFGGKKDKKLKVKNFKRLMISLYPFPVNLQVQKLETFFEAWKGKNEQTDDVTVIAIKMN